MKSLHIGTYWGIPVKVHWTFTLIFLVLFGFGWSNGIENSTLFIYSLFVVLMFVCVILHEYGHALTARRYGVQTLDIIISPIGGIARLQNLPEKPIQELIVAIAGPLVNLAIALILFLATLVFFTEVSFINPEDTFELVMTPFGFIVLMIYVNSVLFLFNLIPAFPMDGGRILRAFLSMRYGRVAGTKYASIVGKILAVGFIIFGILSNHYMLIFIGIFVFSTARSENRQVMIKSKFSDFRAAEIMNTNFSKLHLSTSLRDVYDKYISGEEKTFLVYDSMGNVAGVLPDLLIQEAIHDNDLDATAQLYLSANIFYTDQNVTLDELFEKLNQQGAAIVVIKNGDQILGVIDRQMLFNFIQLQLSD